MEKKNMKKATILAALLAALMLIVSCGGGAAGNPEDDLFNGYAGLSTLNASVPSVDSLEEGESFCFAANNTSLSGLEGRWVAVYIETIIYPAPKYAKKVIEELEIGAITGTDLGTHSCTTTYTYDYSAAIADLGESKWETIKTDIPETGYEVNNYVATQTTGSQKFSSTIGGLFDHFYYPGTVTVNKNSENNADVTKIKVYDSLIDDTKIFVKQNQQN